MRSHISTHNSGEKGEGRGEIQTTIPMNILFESMASWLAFGKVNGSVPSFYINDKDNPYYGLPYRIQVDFLLLLLTDMKLHILPKQYGVITSHISKLTCPFVQQKRGNQC